MKTKTPPKGIFFLFTAAILWGFAFVAQRYGADSLQAFSFNFSRFLLGAFSLIPVILLFERGADDRKRQKVTLLAGIAGGFLLFFASYLQQLGIEWTDSAGKSGFITGLYMILVPILGLFLKKKTGLNTWLGAVLGVAGLFLICRDGGALTFTAGDAVLVGCAVVYAMHILLVDRFGDEVYSLRFSMVQFASSAAFNLIGALLFEELTFSGIAEAKVPILYCGICSVGIAYTCQILGQKVSEPTSASIILSTESVFSAIGGALIRHERMAPPAYAGCVLIFAGIILSQINLFGRKAE